VVNKNSKSGRVVLMVAQLTKKCSEHQQLLIAQLKKLPQKWALTPVFGDKRPYRQNWQGEKPLTKALIERDIRNGKAKGYGLRTGIVSGGIVAVDADGSAAHEKILELSGGVPLPETVAFTSNKPGRCQYLFYVLQEYWGAITTKKINTGDRGDDGKNQQLELRWDGCQSVLPPSTHPETGFYRWRKSPEEVAIAPCPMWLIEQMLIEPASEVKRLEDIQLPVDGVVPLTACLTHRSRDMLSTGAAAPDKGRNDSGAELARDLIGTASYLDVLGQKYNGNPEVLFFEWCRACGLDSDKPKGQPDKIWNSAKKGNATPGSGRVGVDACIRGWDWRENRKTTGRSFSGGIGSGGGHRGNGGDGGSGSGGGDDGDGGDGTFSKVIRFPKFETLTPEQVTEKIDELIVQGATGSYLTGQLNRLAAASQIYIQELRKLFWERSAECDLESARDDNKTQVENLLNLGDQSLELRDFLPEDLAEPLKTWCNWLSLRPEVALTALLTGVSSLHKVGTELVIHRNQTFRVPPTIFSGLVSESGQKKSPILWNIIRHPLNELRQEKIDAYNAAMEDYKAQMQVWEQSEDKGQKPELPKDPTLYYFTNATGEAIPVQAGKAPDKAMLALIDELSGLFNSANSYRGGRGSDKQDILSYFDGSGQTVLRAGGVKVDVRKIYLSVFGTIQPEVLKSHIADCFDPDGQWARFLFVNQPLVAATLSDDDGQFVEIRSCLTGVYRQIDQLPEMEYRLSRPAFKRYQKVYNLLEKLRVTHPKPGMRAVYSKMEGYIGRLALNLHVLWEIASGKACPAEEIPLFILEMAINLAKFYVGQVKLVHSFSDEEGLAPGVVKLIELSKRLDTNGKDGWVRAQQYRELFAAKKRPPAQQVRDLMLEAQSLGYGRTRGTGNRLEYHWCGDNNGDSDNSPTSPGDLGNLGKLREDLGNPIPQAETIGNKSTEANLGNLGKGTPIFSTPLTSGYIPQQTEEEFHEEGGCVPLSSLSTTQEGCDIDTVVNAGNGINSGNGFPNSSLSSLSLAKQLDGGVVEVLTEAVLPLEAVAQTQPSHTNGVLSKLPCDNKSNEDYETGHPEQCDDAFEVKVEVIAPATALQSATEAAEATVAAPEAGARIEVLTGEYKGKRAIVLYRKNKTVWASPENNPEKPAFGYFSDEYRVISDSATVVIAKRVKSEAQIASTTALQSATEAAEVTAAAETLQDGTTKPPTDPITVNDNGWREGDRVLVDASDLPKSLKRFNNRSGVIEVVNVANCLVRFDDDGEVMHILLRGLRMAIAR
jgi:uncharacterized membrane protein YgcG